MNERSIEGLPVSVVHAFAACGVALLVAYGSSAHGQEARTREQVRGELAEALRIGDVIPAGEGSLTLRQRHPMQYPLPSTQAGMTRTQVKAQVVAAIRDGELIEAGEGGQSLRELYPGHYAMPPAVAGKTRTQVQQALAEAIRTGDILAAGESGQTWRDRYPARYGHSARPHEEAAGSPASSGR
jgi:hypothetical protein